MSILSGRSLMHHRYGDGHYQQIIVHTKTGRMLKLDVLDIDEDETCCGPCNTPMNECENGRKEGEMEGGTTSTSTSTPTSSIGSRPLSHHRRQNRPTFFNYHAKHTMMDPACSPSYVNHRSPTSSSSCCDSPVESVMSCRSYSSPPTTPAYRPAVTVDVPQGDDEPIVIDPPTTVTFSHDPSAEVINISITTPVIPPDYKPPPTLSRPLSCPSHHLSVSAPSSAVPSSRSPSQRYAMRRSSDCMIHSSRAYSSTTVHAALASIKSVTPRMPPKKIFSKSAPNSPVAASPSSCDSARSHSSCDVTHTEEEEGNGEGEEGQTKSCPVEKVDIKSPAQVVGEKSVLPSEPTTTTSISISLVPSSAPVTEPSPSPSTSCIVEGEMKLKDAQGEKDCDTKVLENETTTSEIKLDDESTTSESSDDTDSDLEDIKHEYKQEEYKWNDVIPVEIHVPSRRITPIISPHPHKPIRLLPHSPRHPAHAPIHLHMHTHTHTHMPQYNTYPSHHTYPNHTYPTTLPNTSHVQVHTTRPQYISTVQRQLQHLQPMYSPHHVPPPSSHVHPHIYPSPTSASASVSASAAPYHQTVTYSQPSAV